MLQAYDVTTHHTSVGMLHLPTHTATSTTQTIKSERGLHKGCLCNPLPDLIVCVVDVAACDGKCSTPYQRGNNVCDHPLIALHPPPECAVPNLTVCCNPRMWCTET